MCRFVLAALLFAYPVAVNAACPANPPTDPRDCGGGPCIVDIKEADPAIDKAHHDSMRNLLITSVARVNTAVRLGPNVVLDFSELTNLDQPFLQFGPCVTLVSVSSFEPGGARSFSPTGPAVMNMSPSGRAGASSAPTPSGPARPSQRIAPPNVGDMIDFQEIEAEVPRAIGSARTPRSLGPVLKFGPQRAGARTFIGVRCDPDGPPSDGVRISGFRLYGPDFGQQKGNEDGIRIERCVDIEISNMEIAGWAHAAIAVADESPGGGNAPGRIDSPSDVRIFNNFIHHNQHPRTVTDDHATGYGVVIGDGAWAQISENVFDFNRHAIAATGKAGGYDALRNLVLKGGGVHFPPLDIHTHQFDVHGTGDNGFGGQAAKRVLFSQNAFQYRNGPAIKIRGVPEDRIEIVGNVFPHEGLENDWGDDAIHLHDRNFAKIRIGSGNVIDFDSFGRYGVCDFDGDGVDDLFLATGTTWWYSSFGEFHWSFLGARKERLNQLRFGYFDGDKRCDVLRESGGEWQISSGGYGPWQSIGSFDAPLSEVAFGQFDPHHRDHRPGVTRRTTHAFKRSHNGDWSVTPLSGRDWQPVQNSSRLMNELRFGDFTGDGVTDVLAVTGGRWTISESATSQWRALNQNLSNSVSSVFIADVNNNNIDDILRLETQIGAVTSPESPLRVTYAWWISDDGRSAWRSLKNYTFVYSNIRSFQRNPAVSAFAGRFGVAPGAGVLLIGPDRIGRFFSGAEAQAGASPDWKSLFAY